MKKTITSISQYRIVTKWLCRIHPTAPTDDVTYQIKQNKIVANKK